MQVATLAITLPAVPPQAIKQDRREVTVVGSLADGTQQVEVSSTGPIQVRADIDSGVTVGTVEVLVNGKKSNPSIFVFAPADQVNAVAAKAEGYSVKLISIEEIPDSTAPSSPGRRPPII